MFKSVYLILTLFCSISIYSQMPGWHVLPNSPSTVWRHDDISFINENTGWALYNTSFSGSNNGRVYKTTDGGNSWIMQMSVTNIGLRCVGFTDSLHGWIGTLGFIGSLGKTPILYRTIDGGVQWDSVTFEIGNRPGGLCGMNILDRDHVFVCGRINTPQSYTPPYFIKTTNGGLNWITKNMSNYAVELIDCKFFSPDSGFVIGGVDTPVFFNTKNVILFTSDGGNTWNERFRDTKVMQNLWKVSFPSRNTGYCSINSVFTDSIPFIKTTNGGINWFRMSFPVTGSTVTQGIGFVNDNTGWIAGDVNSSFMTTNGGLSWTADNFGSNLNRIRFLNDSIGYAGGQRIYKYTREPIGIQQISREIPKSFVLYQNYPNPFNPSTNIKFEIPKSTFVTIKIFDALGKEIDIPVNQNIEAGSYSEIWDASALPSGIYFYTIFAGDNSESRKMALIK
ncbi:MAG: T9SS type A sorting domain-containing protein [Ignavibacteria bacterium]